MTYNTTAWTISKNTATINDYDNWHNATTTLYTNFGIGALEEARGFVGGRHYPLGYEGVQSAHYSKTDDIFFGEGTDPDTSYTISLEDDDYPLNVDEPWAYNLTGRLWYLPDNIYIDEVFSLEGAYSHPNDVSAGTETYTTRMHLMSYDFTSGNANVLTNGTLLAHNDDVINEGEAKAYLSTWTVDEASVAAGKVVLAFLRHPSDGAAPARPSYSVNVKVKYHLV